MVIETMALALKRLADADEGHIASLSTARRLAGGPGRLGIIYPLHALESVLVNHNAFTFDANVGQPHDSMENR